MTHVGQAREGEGTLLTVIGKPLRDFLYFHRYGAKSVRCLTCISPWREIGLTRASRGGKTCLELEAKDDDELAAINVDNGARIEPYMMGR